MDYLIENTTREDRIKLVKDALGISLSGASIPSDDTLKLVKEYIDGNMELEEVQKQVVERYKK